MGSGVAESKKRQKNVFGANPSADEPGQSRKEYGHGDENGDSAKQQAEVAEVKDGRQDGRQEIGKSHYRKLEPASEEGREMRGQGHTEKSLDSRDYSLDKSTDRRDHKPDKKVDGIENSSDAGIGGFGDRNGDFVFVPNTLASCRLAASGRVPTLKNLHLHVGLHRGFIRRRREVIVDAISI